MDSIVRDLSELLSIDIFEGAEWDDNEIYHTKEIFENPYRITFISVVLASKQGYLLDSGNTIYPHYIVFCNIITDDTEDCTNNSTIEQVRNKIKVISEMEEIGLEIDEW